MELSDRVGVVDLGTNTFHLLIVEPVADGNFKEVHRERRYIRLAEGGIDNIAEGPFDRALKAMLDFRQTLDREGVHRLKAFGTAALRTASNGPELISEIYKLTGIMIELISGVREADLIHKGVSLAAPFNLDQDLIMDIGGGSVEFILADGQVVHWSYSFPVGVAVLFNGFHSQDPISHLETKTLEAFLSTTLSPLWEAAKNYPPRRLIGASGTFDVIESILAKERLAPHYSQIEKDPFYPMASGIIESTLMERLARPDVPDSRADMIVVALILIKKVLTALPSISNIGISTYAMKEGMLSEMIG